MLKNRMDSFGVAANSVHAFCATFEHQLFSEYERRRKDALVLFRKVLEAAVTLNAKSYTFHGDKRADSLKYVDFKHYGKCFDELLTMAEHYGVALGWENVAWCQSSRPEFIDIIKKSVSKDSLKYTLDIKQARRAGIDIEDYIAVMGSEIVNVHVNDYNKTSTCMLPGDGDVDFKDFFNKLSKSNYNSNAIIEVYSSNYKEISQLKKSLEYLNAVRL